MNLQAPNIIPYMLGLVIAYLFIIIFIVMVSSGVSSLTTEMQKTELIDNRFVIRKEFEHAQVANATKRLAKEIHKRYENENFKILTLGMGGLYFVNKLIGELKWQNKVNVEFISAFSKREGEVVTIVPPDRSDLQNKHILIVDDLVSTGLTLKEAVAMCKGLGAQSVQTCVLLDAYNKRHSKCAGLTIDFAGLRSPERNLFFVGSGMDGGEKMSVESADKCRSLPYIGVIVAP
jgi:hypoxanthine phosphoribosyltransferase